jgi:hypothetical protein
MVILLYELNANIDYIKYTFGKTDKFEYFNFHIDF